MEAARHSITNYRRVAFLMWNDTDVARSKRLPAPPVSIALQMAFQLECIEYQ